MQMPDEQEPPTTREPKRSFLPRFSITTLLVVMVLFSVMGAAIHYGLQAVDAGVPFEAMLVVLAIIAPPLMILTLKLGLAVARWSRRNDPPH